MESVNLSVQKTKTIDLVFNLNTDLKDATLSLELPDKIEIVGYPGKRQLKWTASFKQGANRLALPLIATDKMNGYLIASLIKNGETKQFRIKIDSKQPASSKIFLNEMVKNT